MPGIFLTAKHVISGSWSNSNDSPNPNETPPDYEEDNKLQIVHRLKNNKIVLWTVTKASDVPNLDISILLCEKWSSKMKGVIEDVDFPRTNIDLHLPIIGQPVSALGYPGTISKTHPEGGYLHSVNLRRAQGVIENVYLKGAGLVKTPCFQINAEIKPGMSGGPVFTKDGYLCGIISSGYEPTEDFPFYTTFISLLWQAFIAPINTTLWGGKGRTLSLLYSDYLRLDVYSCP